MDFGNSTPKIHKFTNPLVKICQNFKNYLTLFFFAYIWCENNEWNMILRADFLFLNRFQPPFEHECAKVRNGVEFSVEADVLVRQFNAELYVAVIFLCNQVV